MKRIVIFLMVGIFVFGLVPTGICQERGHKGQKGASEKAYEHASDQSVFNRIGDWFATLGYNKEEKQQILEQRRNERRKKRLKKKAKQKRESIGIGFEDEVVGYPKDKEKHKRIREGLG